jgi:hypothetical protein
VGQEKEKSRLRSTMSINHPMVKEFVHFVLLFSWGMKFQRNKITKTPRQSMNCKLLSQENHMMMNKALFEEKWSVIRGQSTEWWSLMADYDLVKVDKADVKFDKFVTMLQVKYGYTRQQAREEIARLWSEYSAKNKKTP